MTTMTAKEAFHDCLEATQMARHNIRVCRRAGDREASRAALERACWYLDLARRWRSRK